MLFLQLQTQWRRAGQFGAMVGLDYIAVESTMRLLDIQPNKELFDGLRTMEFAALEELAKA